MFMSGQEALLSTEYLAISISGKGRFLRTKNEAEGRQADAGMQKNGNQKGKYCKGQLVLPPWSDRLLLADWPNYPLSLALQLLA